MCHTFTEEITRVLFSLRHSKLGFARYDHTGIPSMDAQHNIYLYLIAQAALLCCGCGWGFILWMWLLIVPEKDCLSRDDVPLDYTTYIGKLLRLGLCLVNFVGKKLFPHLGCRAVQA